MKHFYALPLITLPLALTFGLFFMTGCTIQKQSPDFYPNTHFDQVGDVQAHVDSDRCISLADEYAKQPEQYKEMVKHTAVAGTVGSATGALAGVIVGGNVGRSLGAGAAVGAIVSIVNDLFTADKNAPSYERFVEHCLNKEGYEVIGWSRKG
ncbi:hypothetical protein OAO01_01300 [Oligoflexia bacterium]|nr:hypothetical protein [Oligoflexia bacterium]